MVLNYKNWGPYMMNRLELKVKGKKLNKRRFHSASVVGTKMLVFGGCHGNYKCLKYKMIAK